MPYIAIKAYPKDEAIKKEVVDKVFDAFAELWGCPREAISISLEEVDPADWEQVVRNEIEPKQDKLMVRDGKKLYE
ncbi:MAG: tautomerase family protein [Oscillospiraceae bacterium]|nr:tautomerase family protein [Oscillospiraceae bacterium]